MESTNQITEISINLIWRIEMKRNKWIINNVEIAVKDSAIKKLYLEALSNGFNNQLGFDCIKFESLDRGIEIKIDVDPQSKVNGSYVLELKTTAIDQKREYYTVSTFSIIDYLRNKPQKQITEL